MSAKRKFTQSIISILVLFTLSVSAIQPAANVAAQGTDGIKRDYNAETGKVSRITGVGNEPITLMGAMSTDMTSQQRNDVLVRRFAPEFGITNPSRDLKLAKTDQPSAGRVVTRYQQVYQNVPVMGGELIVNASDTGALYSMNGEVSQGLSLDINPTVSVEAAIEIAQKGMMKWYGGEAGDYVQSSSSLTIFDEKLLRPSIRPAELAWKIEMVPLQQGEPIRELVMVNAKTGNISLHFNQIDTAWSTVKPEPIQQADPTETPEPIDTPVPTETPLPTETQTQPVVSTDAPQLNETTTDNSSSNDVGAISGTTWYVATTGNDVNDCLSPASPCATINGAIGKASNGNTIKVAIGVYTGSGTEVVLINKSITLSGGWNTSFSTQGGTSTIDGQATIRCLTVNSDVTATIERFTIQNGSEPYEGGGGILNNGNLIINLSTVRENVAGSDGAGILNTGALTLNSSSVTGNTGEYQGGIANGGYWINLPVRLTINNSTVSNNIGRYGSGIGNGQSGIIYLNNATVSGNTSRSGYRGGIYNNDGGQVTLQNTILAGNTQDGLASDCYGSLISAGYNLIGSNSDCTFAASIGDLIGTSSNPINPLLAPLHDNGGPTLTQALMVGSHAIDAGNPLSPGINGKACLATDQTGSARPVGKRCDIGAYEGSVPWMPLPLIRTFQAYTNSIVDLPGFFLCDQTQPNCTNNSNPHADGAHKYAIGTYDLYSNKYLRDSVDNKGMVIISSVHFGSGYDNAFWSGTQMVYGDAYDFPLADDIVAHELTHGVTQYESNLFYFYQSGAIDESISDVFGEYYDQTNSLGTDTPDVKWLLGEDVTGLGAVRSMSNPPEFGDPDKMTSTLYKESSWTDVTDWDNGGVHSNSGVNNKAVFLMVDGGAFNGKTVTGIGWDKTAAVYYEANTNLLTSGSDYSDLYYAIQQACVNLTGSSKGITSADCVQVKDALDAVEMNLQPTANFNPDATDCPAGLKVAQTLPLFKDDMESGVSKWNISGSWSLDTFYASSPTHMMWGDDSASSNESILTMKNGVPVPTSSMLFIIFKHAYAFEFDNTTYYDGGVLEYTRDNGTHWLDASPLYSDGQNYNGIMDNDPLSANVLKGRSGFVGDSHGYVSSRYNLTSLAGQTVKFRWRFATDESASYWGWFLDDVKIYRCMGAPSIPILQAPTNKSLTTNYTPLLNWKDSTPSPDHYQVQIATDNTFASVAYDVDNLNVSQYQIPSELNHNTIYYWRVQAFSIGNGSIGWSPVWSFRTALTPPTLDSPANGFASLELRPIFTWSDSNIAPLPTGYIIQISKNNTFTQIVKTASTTSSTYTPTTDLPKQSITVPALYWRVQAKGANGPSAWSDYRSLTTPINPPPAPTLLLPASNSLMTTYKPIFTWKAVVPPAGTSLQNYIIQVDNDSDFSSPIEGLPVTPTFTPSTDLNSNVKYYWRVRAINTAGEMGNWSAVRYFRSAILPPNPLSTTVGSLKPTLDWSDVDGNTGYTLKIWKGGTTPVLVKTVNLATNTSQYTVTTALLPNTAYFWKVQTKGVNGPSLWSEPWDFTTMTGP